MSPTGRAYPTAGMGAPMGSLFLDCSEFSRSAIGIRLNFGIGVGGVDGHRYSSRQRVNKFRARSVSKDSGAQPYALESGHNRGNSSCGVYSHRLSFCALRAAEPSGEICPLAQLLKELQNFRTDRLSEPLRQFLHSGYRFSRR